MRKTKFVSFLEQCPKSVLSEATSKCTFDRSIVNLGTAENRLMDDWILPLIQDRSRMTMKDTTYFAAFNCLGLQKAVANFYEAYFGMKSVDPSHIMVCEGIALLVERLSLVLCEPGDVILLPKPCYGCFEPDMFISGAKIEYISLENLPEEPPENARLLILTNPGNPIGKRLENAEEILKWAFKCPNLHVLADEVYGLTNREGKPFTSLMELECADPMRLHQTYGMSKDWGLAGFHVSFFYSKNDDIRQQLKLAFGCTCMSSDTKWIIERILSDKDFVKRYVEESPKRLSRNEQICCDLLKEAGIEFQRYPNSLFVIADFRKFIHSPDEELAVWRTMIDKYHVHIAPGVAAFHFDEPGLFRICFSVDEEKLRKGMANVTQFFKEFTSKV